MLTLYGDRRSGNCYKVELLLHLLERHHHYIEVDILAGDTRTPEFLTRNVNGKIPLAGAASRRDAVRVERHPELSRRWQRLPAE